MYEYHVHISSSNIITTSISLGMFHVISSIRSIRSINRISMVIMVISRIIMCISCSSMFGVRERGSAPKRGRHSAMCVVHIASAQWQVDGLAMPTKKWFPGAGFLGAPPISLNV